VNEWNHFEEIHNDYISGIKDEGRLEIVQAKYTSIKELAGNVLDEFKRQLQANDLAARDDVSEVASVRSDFSHLSRASSSSSQKQKLKTMLLAQRKLELAKSRQYEEIENARILQEMNARKEIRKLEEEAALAEVEWQVETECGPNGEIQAEAYDDHGNSQYGTPKVDTFKPYQTALPTMSTLKPNATPPEDYSASSVFNIHRPTSCRPGHEDEQNLPERCTSPYDGQQTPSAPRVPVYDGQQTPSAPLAPVYDDQRTVPRVSVLDNERAAANLSTCTRKDNQVTKERDKSMDHIATMLKIQLLNGIKPTQFSGKPADFPFLRKQLKEHLETELLSDAQRVEYLSKFLCGDALEVIKRNRGCSYKDLVHILETRFGRPIQVSQACIEELVSGPKLNYGDNVGLLNFAERLTTATKILTGADEKEISVATNLRKIVNRLPNDLVSKWQNLNYEITSRGSSARLKDIADFVRKHATIRNDPVYGSPRRDHKDTKGSTKTQANTRHPTPRLSTVATANVQKDVKDTPSTPKD
jgi:hypothetical protein